MSGRRSGSTGARRQGARLGERARAAHPGARAGSLAPLVADGLGYGNVDFRYLGLPDHGPARVARVQAELDELPAGFAITVPPLMLLDGLRLRADHLSTC